MSTHEYPNWFSMVALPYFEQYKQLFDPRKPLRMVQIGAYVGHASEWISRNWLQHRDSFLIDVDTWQGSDESAHKAMDWADVYRTYNERVRLLRGVMRYVGKSDDFFRWVYNEDWLSESTGTPEFDFIYIDGDHTRGQVHRDAVNAWHALAVGGVIAFDDYTWGLELDAALRPYEAINTFINTVPGCEVLCVGAQVWIRKRKDAI